LSKTKTFFIIDSITCPGLGAIVNNSIYRNRLHSSSQNLWSFNYKIRW